MIDGAETSAPSYNIAMVGCGKMGSAMAGAWLQSGLAKSLHILKPTVPTFGHAVHYTDPVLFSAALKDADILIIAVKPQIIDEVYKTLTLPPNLCVLSIATGKTLSYFAKLFGNQPVIRTMPNTPSAIGKGMIVACHSDNVSDTQKQMAQTLLNKLGKTEWTDSETIMDAVTAVSGSGPAYVFYLIEALAHAGMDQGLGAELSMRLARQTVIGAAALSEKEASTEVSQLRERVTSPNGTTAAALEVLMAGDFQKILSNAVAKAAARASELSQ